MKIESWDDEGNPHIGRKGELVCTEPFPSMPVFFWNDPDGHKYRAAYFGRFPDVWYHGDFVRITSRGSAVLYGRSDATLNRGGVRVGTAEIFGVRLTVGEMQSDAGRRAGGALIDVGVDVGGRSSCGDRRGEQLPCEPPTRGTPHDSTDRHRFDRAVRRDR